MHVDIVKNEWLAGFQYVAARISLEDGQFSFDSGEPHTWEDVVLRPLPDPQSDDLVYPEKEPQKFLMLLPANIRGSYLWATSPHEEKECEFEQLVVRMQPAGRHHSAGAETG